MKPEFTITNEILNLTINIVNAISNLDKLNTPNFRLRKDNRIRAIHSSLAIEGNMLSVEQVTAMIDGQRVLGDLREIKEVQNAISVYDQLNNLDPYSMSDLLAAHKLLTSDLIVDSGTFRSADVGVFDNEGEVIHIGARPQFVYELIEELLAWGKQSDVHPLIKSCVIHYELESIHPFSDGNGRIGRLWQTLILREFHTYFEWIPVETIIYENQSKYYGALKQSDNSVDCAPFILFMLESIEKAIGLYGKNDAIEGLTEKENRVYSIVRNYLENNKFITTGEVSVMCEVSPATARRYFTKFTVLKLLKHTGDNKGRKYTLVSEANE